LPTISFAAASTGNVGTARTITPTTYNGGTNISNCTVSPALPAGLSISTSTCVISGTPSSPAGPTTHTVTIHNSAGTGTGTISIMVSGYVCTTLGYDGPSTVVTSTSSCWYSCSTRGYSGGNQNSLSSCYKDCNASNQCGGIRYYPSTCYAKTFGYFTEDFWEIIGSEWGWQYSCTPRYVPLWGTDMNSCNTGSSYYAWSEYQGGTPIQVGEYNWQCSDIYSFWVWCNGVYQGCPFTGNTVYFQNSVGPGCSTTGGSWRWADQTYVQTYIYGWVQREVGGYYCQ
jgi:hypothetical protein